MISVILNILSFLTILISYTLYKVFDKRHSSECRKCYDYTNKLNKKGYCSACNREIKISYITQKFNFKLDINPEVSNIIYWVLVSISISLNFLSLIYKKQDLLIYGSISLFIGSVIYLFSLCKELKFKKHGDNS